MKYTWGHTPFFDKDPLRKDVTVWIYRSDLIRRITGTYAKVELLNVTQEEARMAAHNIRELASMEQT